MAFSLPFSKIQKKSKNDLLSDFLSSFSSKIAKMNFRKKDQLPTQSKARPVILFNPEKLLFIKKPSLFNYQIVCRPFYDLFLFDLAHHFELISHLKGTKTEKDFIYEHIDPYGCISYRLNNEETDLNRTLDNVIIIETEDNQWNSKYGKNILKVQEWNGKYDEKIFLLEQFLSNLLYVDRKTWFSTIHSYMNTPFFEAYDYVQKRLFLAKNFFSTNYCKFMENVKKQKLKEFENAKIVMNEQIRKDKAFSDIINPIIGLIKTLLI